MDCKVCFKVSFLFLVGTIILKNIIIMSQDLLIVKYELSWYDQKIKQ